MSTYTFTIPVNPVAKGRPRFGKGRTYTPAKTLAYEQHVAAAALKAKLPVFTTPLTVTITCFCEPKRGPLADVDNYAKAVLDGLKDHFNDRLVCSLKVTREKALAGEGRAYVTIEPKGART